MTEYEIVQFIEHHIEEYGLLKKQTWLRKPELPTLEPMIRDMPGLGLQFVLTPLAYAIGEVAHPQGDDIRISTMQDILNVIKARREEMGFHKIDDIATLLGITEPYYSRLERGRYQMSLKFLLRICRMLWIDVRVEQTDNPYSSDLFG